MKFQDEGVNLFSNYDTLIFKLESGRKKQLNTVQISFGGYSYHKGEDVSREKKLFRHGLKQLFSKKSKDGYYKPQFIFLDGFTEGYDLNKQGLLFHKVFFYLEESYERGFVIDYLKTLFQDIDDYHKSNPYFRFHKYKPKRIRSAKS